MRYLNYAVYEMTELKVKAETRGAVRILTLNDPPTLNALSWEMTDQLCAELRKVSLGVEPARAVLLTGEGRAFCSGANLSGGGALGRKQDVDGKPDSSRIIEQAYNPLMGLIRGLPVPILAAVNGPAAGIGCSLALMCDLILASESAYFLLAFRRIGLVPDGGASFTLPRLVGKARAMELMLMGERLPARKALEWGLINRCVSADAMTQTALSLVEQLAEGPASMGLIRQQVWASLDNGWNEQLDVERRLQQAASKTDDYREGVEAFLQKRPAEFAGH